MNCRCLSHNSFLTERGYAELAQRNSLEGLTPGGDCVMVDMPVSVSGLELERDLYAIQTSDQLLEQSERFLNGS